MGMCYSITLPTSAVESSPKKTPLHSGDTCGTHSEDFRQGRYVELFLSHKKMYNNNYETYTSYRNCENIKNKVDMLYVIHVQIYYSNCYAHNHVIKASVKGTERKRLVFKSVIDKKGGKMYCEKHTVIFEGHIIIV